MQILSHRGHWKNPVEKNSMEAMKRSFGLGFGVETDIRDFNGKIVISHDFPDDSSPTLRQFLEIYSQNDTNLYLALNVKSDGLQTQLKNLLTEFCVENYFVFDMSVPDGLLYLKHDLKSFTRQSEYEKIPSLYDKTCGVWMDCFISDWICYADIKQHLENNKMVCVVSPELHKRNYHEVWNTYKSLAQEKNFFLCSDYPEEAKLFFNL